MFESIMERIGPHRIVLNLVYEWYSKLSCLFNIYFIWT